MNATTEIVKNEQSPADNGSLLSVIARAASDPSVDIDKLERLLEMQERVVARDAERRFNEAMAAAQKEMPQIKRGGKNSTTNSTYAELDAMSEAMLPIIAKHGFALSFGTDVSPLEKHYRVTCDVSHIGGHTRRYVADVPADLTGMKGTQNKTSTHAFGSTLSYGRRYLKMLIFDVATTDDDGRAASGGELIDNVRLKLLNDLADAVGADKEKLCKHLKIDALNELPFIRYDYALARLREKNPVAAEAFLTGKGQ